MLYLTKSFLNIFKAKVKAFSLIEMCIFLLILGTLSSSTLALFKIVQKNQRQNTTNDHFIQITYALANHVLRNKSLPCPANKDGVSIENCTQKIGGFVPYKTLGISKKITLDGFGRPIMYVADASLTDSLMLKEINSATEDNPNRVFCHTVSYNPIVIKDSMKQPVKELALDINSDQIAFLLMSNTSNFDETNFSFEFKESDQFMWITRSNFMSYYAKVPCMPKN